MGGPIPAGIAGPLFQFAQFRLRMGAIVPGVSERGLCQVTPSAAFRPMHLNSPNLDPIDRCDYQTSRPLGAEYPIALQLTGHLAAQGKQSIGIAPF